MIKPHSDDPDIAAAASDALSIINDVLTSLPVATTFDYGGHILKLDDYGVCTRCTVPIAEAQAAEQALAQRLETISDETVRTHIELAIQLFKLEAEAAVARAEFHNGDATEPILNRLLGFQYERHIGDDYQHSHNGGQA